MTAKRVIKMNKNSKINVTVTLEELSPEDFEGTLSSISALINALILKHGMDAKMEWDPDRWHPYADSPSPTYWIKTTRPETDDEMKARLEDHELKKTAQLERDRVELARLKLKLGEK